jgi:hypothetical protein
VTAQDEWAPPAFVSLDHCASPPLQLGVGSAPKNSASSNGSGCMGGRDGGAWPSSIVDELAREWDGGSGSE